MSTAQPDPTLPVHVVHRVGAAALAVVLWVFAVLGYVNGLAPFSTRGTTVMGMSSNGLLSTVSVAAGAVLLAAAAWKGRAASTITATMGALFLLSGLAHLTILDSSLNVLDFGLTNVYFSLGSGMVLLFLGLYGRLSGGLPADNPYRVSRTARHLAQHRETGLVRRQRPQLGDPVHEADRAQSMGAATAEQRELLRASEEQHAGKQEGAEPRGGGDEPSEVPRKRDGGTTP